MRTLIRCLMAGALLVPMACGVGVDYNASGPSPVVVAAPQAPVAPAANHPEQ